MENSIRSELKNNLKLSIPLVASQLVYSCSSFLGVAMVARLGQNALAASILVTIIWFVLSVFFFSILNAISVLIAHQVGAENKTIVGKIMGQAWMLGLLIIIITSIILSSMTFFLHWSTQPPAVLKLAHQYIKAIRLMIPPAILLVIIEQFLIGLGQTRLVLKVSLLIVPLEIVIIYLLIFGKLGLPSFGVAGVGYGLAISYSLTCCGLLLYLLLSKKFQSYALFACIKHSEFGYFKELIRIGLPMGLMSFLEVGAFAVMTYWIAQFGTTTLAAHQIVFQFASFAITAIFALSQGTTVRVGHTIGKHNHLLILNAAFAGLIIGLGFISFISLFFITFTQQLIYLDIHTAHNMTLVIQSSKLFKIMSILLLFESIRLMGFGVLRGIKDVYFPMFASFIGFWIVGLSFAYLFGFIFHWQGIGIWLGITLGIISSAIIVIWRLYIKLKTLDPVKVLAITT